MSSASLESSSSAVMQETSDEAVHAIVRQEGETMNSSPPLSDSQLSPDEIVSEAATMDITDGARGSKLSRVPSHPVPTHQPGE